jgi:macrodomain Ter protein organizer (MatP/YcbG family)
MKHTPSKRIKVENHPNLKRDVKTRAIVNTDSSAFERYMNEKEVRNKQQNEIESLRQQIEDLKNMILNK